jgi:hypothetical protein
METLPTGKIRRGEVLFFIYFKKKDKTKLLFDLPTSGWLEWRSFISILSLR